MFPFRTSTVFRSRWMALLWAAGFIWMAVDVASAGKKDEDAPSEGSGTIADVTGAPLSSDDINAFSQELNAF